MLVELLLAVAIMGTTFPVFMAALSSSSIHARNVGINVEADNISRGQRAYTMEQTYVAPPASYAIVSLPQGWTVTADAEVVPATNSNTENIITTVSYNGQVKLVAEDIRIN